LKKERERVGVPGESVGESVGDKSRENLNGGERASHGD